MEPRGLTLWQGHPTLEDEVGGRPGPTLGSHSPTCSWGLLPLGHSVSVPEDPREQDWVCPMATPRNDLRKVGPWRNPSWEGTVPCVAGVGGSERAGGRGSQGQEEGLRRGHGTLGPSLLGSPQRGAFHLQNPSANVPARGPSVSPQGKTLHPERPHLWPMKIPTLGVKLELPTPQPQQRRIQTVSVTYTTAHGNAGSFTH